MTGATTTSSATATITASGGGGGDNHHHLAPSMLLVPPVPAAAAAVTAPPVATATVPLPTRMVLGAVAGMGAATFCHPLDVIRVRLQTTGGGAGGGVLRTALTAYHQGGLYAGIGAAYLRQWTYGSCRMGIYSYLLEQHTRTTDTSSDAVPFSRKLGMGMVAGAIGSLAGTPSELALVRLSNDGKLPPSERRNYRGVVACLRRIALEEGGIRAWWTGATPTVLRATVLSACLMGGTSQAKTSLRATGWFEATTSTSTTTTPAGGNHEDASHHHKGDWLHGIPLLFCATLISSFCANLCANPFDVVKSRMQNMPAVNAAGEAPLYRGSLDCLRTSVATEGVWVLSRGFGPAFVKLAPYTVISLTLVDTMTRAATGRDAL